MILVCVTCSSAAKTVSELRPTVTALRIGNTQAKDAGAPAYLIWSQRLVCSGEMLKIILWSVTTVPLWLGGSGS